MSRVSNYFRRFRKLLILLFFIGCVYFLTRRTGNAFAEDDTPLHPSRPETTNVKEQPGIAQDVLAPQKSRLSDDDEVDEEDIEDDYYAALRPARLRNRPGVPVPPLDQGEALRDSDPLPQHVYRSNGLVEVNPEGRHPIYDLMERAEKEWNDKLQRQSMTLEDAVLEYKRRYARLPPPGFDRWWRYAQDHHIQLIDEYDKITESLEPFWGVDPLVLQEIQAEWETKPDIYTIGKARSFGAVQLLNMSVSEGIREMAEWRSQLQIDVIKEISMDLPPFRASFTAHDGPYQFWAHDVREAAISAAADERYIDYSQVPFQPYLGWASACPPGTPLHDDVWENHPNPADLHAARPKTFIHDHVKSMDPCIHNEAVHLSGFLSNHGKGPGPGTKVVPSFSMCATTLHSDILAVAPEQWTEYIEFDPPWEEKQNAQLFWRGSNTGAEYSHQTQWNISQRIRLIDQSMDQDGTYGVLLPTDRFTPVGSEVKKNGKLLAERFMSVSFVEGAIQCEDSVCDLLEQKYTFGEVVNHTIANQFKYMIDVDGNGWSARFKRLMTTRSCILKATTFPEWYADRIQPWLHYIPIKNDFSDLYDVMTFFQGSPDGDGSDGNDDLARIVGEEGRIWSKEFYRRVDMTAYMFRLYLEYARVMDVDRDYSGFQL
ncbi:hypothetical protein SISNIDRAFT_448018 [Sistotremastrum niveocremeum HHB9708]|uniref:Glycosyl transferase CAP10 domain-containing protein n=1 Tax=Sistotremastrum niveocremeum HHB9708 TaxID=1314777 RepID=A0A165AKH4_9AGAM|nr:hypothetical protein SISNIDRAFT_448018 [Sistotremastrum niveocremeum HHB9708]